MERLHHRLVKLQTNKLVTGEIEQFLKKIFYKEEGTWVDKVWNYTLNKGQQRDRNRIVKVILESKIRDCEDRTRICDREYWKARRKLKNEAGSK